MDTFTAPQTSAHQTSAHQTGSPQQPEPTLTLARLAAELGVKVKVLYDLRSKGREPCGFRVGREVRFRRSAVDAWLADLEAEDARRHPRRAS